jgi:hypothetical protein
MPLLFNFSASSGPAAASSPANVSYGSALAAGTFVSVLVADAYGHPNSVTGITDSAGNTYHLDSAVNEADGDGSVFVASCVLSNPVTTSDNLIITFDSGVWLAFYVTGIAFSNVLGLDVAGTPVGISGSGTLVSSVSANSGDLLIAYATFQGTILPDSGSAWKPFPTPVMGDAANQTVAAWQQVSSSSNVTFTTPCTGSGDFGASIICAYSTSGIISQPINLGFASAAAISEADVASVDAPFSLPLPIEAGAATEADLLVRVSVRVLPNPVRAVTSAGLAIFFIGGRFVQIRPGLANAGIQRQPEYEWILCKKPTPPAFTNPTQVADMKILRDAVVAQGGSLGPLSTDWPSFFIDEPLLKVGPLSNIHNRTFQIVANRAGSASFTIRTNSDMAAEILNGVDFGDVRGTVRHCLRIRRNKVDLWSGPIWGIQGDLDNGLLNISCVGWLETLQHRILWGVADYSGGGFGTEPNIIAFDLLGQEALQNLDHPPLVIPGSLAGTLQVRNRFYTRGQNIGQALQELSDIEDGYDYEVDPLTRRMNLIAPELFEVREDVRLGYNWGPNNLKNVQWQEDASRTCNYMSVQSQGAPVVVYDDTSIAQYDLFEENNTLTSANQGILAPYAAAELFIRGRPMVTYSLQPQPFGPRLFDDFQIRDQIFFDARKDHVKIRNQGIRVFGATVQIDDNGNEAVSELMTAPSS